jgi:hypothetical protein
VLLTKFNRQNLFLILLLGILAGLSAAIKLHAFLYVFGAIIALDASFLKQVRLILLFGVGAMGAIMLSFVPPQVSLFQFLFYIKLASLHGIEIKMVLENISYLLIIFFPIIYILIKRYSEKKEVLWNINGFILIATLVAIIGAKPGSGTHHLLPFIPIVAYVLQSLGFSKISSPNVLRGFRVSILFLLMGPILITELQFCRAMIVHFKEEKSSASDLYEIARQYPGVLLAPSDTANYHSILLNPVLQKNSITQLDVPGYTDLNLSGISDSSLTQRIQECHFNFIATPKLGEPFSISSGYLTGHLFSEELRKSFFDKYEILSTHGNYLVYKCSRKNDH